MSNPPTEPIRFLLNGDEVAVAGLSPQTTLLDYLRTQRALTGTKEGCAEGDCGACTVVLAEPADDGGLVWIPINACIRLLPTVDGRAVFTVEGLKLSDGRLHPVQEALAREHGSQCGFCTPGFVMSLFALYKCAPKPSGAQVTKALAGNLCRCTGYRPILAAAQTMAELPSPGGWRGAGRADGARVVDPEEAALAARLRELARPGGFVYRDEGQSFHAPVSVDALAEHLAQAPQARLVAGATDVGLWVTKQQRALGDLVATGNVDELKAIARDDRGLAIGAAVSLERAFAALCDDWPELAETWERFASPPIRNAGTLCGNIANASPIGDAMPALLALDATLELRRGATTRTLPIAEYFTGYRETARAPGEFIVRVRVPARAPGCALRAFKLARRRDQDISTVALAIAIECSDGRIAAARIGCGGVAATPRWAPATEGALIGRTWDAATARSAVDVIANEFAPIADLRAGERYRQRALARLLWRFWLETDPARDAAIALRIDDVVA